jgi:hypothetical protein
MTDSRSPRTRRFLGAGEVLCQRGAQFHDFSDDERARSGRIEWAIPTL